MKMPGKDTPLGIAMDKRRYDLPLNKDEGTNFLKLLIALMSFLAVIALAGSLALGSMTERWTSGLENRLTIEIPAETDNGALRTKAETARLAEQVEEALRALPGVQNVHILNDSDIQALVEPWLGKDAPLQDIPLPGMIAVEISGGEPGIMDQLGNAVASIDSGIIVDKHETWLQSLLRLTSSLRLGALVIVLVIGATTVTAIAGAIRSRIALHRADVELLHIMGAHDEYIVRQFQRHALIIALQGSAAGTILAVMLLLAAGLAAGNGQEELLPGFSLQAMHAAILAAMPVAACLIAALTARFTVLRSLSVMP